MKRRASKHSQRHTHTLPSPLSSSHGFQCPPLKSLFSISILGLRPPRPPLSGCCPLDPYWEEDPKTQLPFFFHFPRNLKPGLTDLKKLISRISVIFSLIKPWLKQLQIWTHFQQYSAVQTIFQHSFSVLTKTNKIFQEFQKYTP